MTSAIPNHREAVSVLDIILAFKTLLLWTHRDVSRPPMNGVETRELEHHILALSTNPCVETLAQSMHFIDYLTGTFGAPLVDGLPSDPDSGRQTKSQQDNDE